MKLYYLAIAAVTAIPANIGSASAAVSFLSIITHLLRTMSCVHRRNKDFTRTLLPTYLYLTVTFTSHHISLSPLILVS